MKRLVRFIYLLLLIASNALAQTADFTADVISGCNPLLVKFTDKSIGTIAGTIYTWDFGDSKTSTLASPSTTYTTAGTYTVKLTVKNSSTGTPSVKTMNITVHPLPVVSFSASSLSVCPCSIVSFTNTSAATAPGTYTSLWSFGDGGTSLDKDAIHDFCVTGVYDIALKVTNSLGCNDTKLDKAKIRVWEKPKADFYASKTDMCKLPDSTIFTSTSSKGKAPYTYFWDFGDLSTSSSASPKHIYTTAGIYTVKLILTDANGCKDTMVKVDYINASKISDFSTSNRCLGDVSVFYNTSKTTPTSTTWLFGDSYSASGISSVNHQYASSGTYTVTMINYFSGGCVDTVKKAHTIYPKPKPDFSYSPIYSCPAPATIDFVNKSVDAVSYVWVFGDGSTSTAISPSHTYTRDSIYVAYLIAQSSYGCLDTFRVRDTSKAFPAGYPKKFYDSSNSPVIIRVYSGRAEILGGNGISLPAGCLPVPVKPRVKLYTRTYLPYVQDSTTGGRFCVERKTDFKLPFWYCHMIWGDTGILATVPVPIDAYPDPYWDPPYIPTDDIYAREDDYRLHYPVKIKSYNWDFGDGYTSTLDTPSHVYTSEGTYTIRVSVISDSGCVFTDSILVSRGEKPIANFTISDTNICNGQTITFTRTSTGTGGWTWYLGDDLPGSDTCICRIDPSVFTHKYNFDGTAVYVTHVASNYGCTDTITKKINIDPPSSKWKSQYSCDTPLMIRFKDGSWRATSVLWRFGDGDSSTLRNPIHFYPGPGIYHLEHIAYNDTFGCEVLFDESIWIKDTKPNFAISDSTLCVGDEITLTITPDSYYRYYTWLINKKPTPYSYPFLVTHKFIDTGTYSISLVAKNVHECLDTVTKFIIVGQPITKIVASPLKSCAPFKVNFRDSSIDTKGTSIVSRYWFWDDASTTTSISDTASHFFNTEKVYNIQLVSTDNIGCTDTATIAVDSRKPKASFYTSVDSFGCIGYGITFYNTSIGTGLKYYWDFGDGSFSTTVSPVHAYKALGKYTVRLKITDDIGCQDSITKTDYITLTKPTASFLMKDSIAFCPPLFDTFTNTSTNAITYKWDFDNGSFSVLKDPVGFFYDTGRYQVQLVAFNEHGCPDTAYNLVRVFGYKGAIKYAPLYGCAPWKVDFEIENLNAAEMTLDFADGVTENVIGKTKTSHIYKNPGSYKPQLIFGDGKDCKAFSLGLDTIKVDGVTPFISFSPACAGSVITFNDSSYSIFSKHYSSYWTFEDGTVQKIKNPLRYYEKAGVYTIKLKTENTTGCEDSIIFNLTVHPLPKIKTIDTLICLGDQIVLGASGADTFTWMPHPTLSCTDCSHPLASPLVKTNYIVFGTDANGCKNKDTLTVRVKTHVTILVPDSAEVCTLKPIQLLVSGAEKYIWSPATFLNNPNIANPIATMDSSITYQVIGYEAACIPDTANVKVIVHPLPIVNAGPDQKVTAGSTVQFDGQGSNVKSFSWTPAENLSCSDCPKPKSSAPSIKTTYLLRATSEYGCSDSDEVVIDIYCNQSQLFLPNSFTPNGDGQNDYFYPQGDGVTQIKSFIIYNRWGQKMFERNNMTTIGKEQGWDGTYAGEKLNSDTYVYTLEAVCDKGEIVFIKGDITLIR